MLVSIKEVVTDEKARKSVNDSIKQTSLSFTSTMRRFKGLASEVFKMLLNKFRKAEFMSLAVDKSIDNSDMAQLCFYVPFFDRECFREDLLGH